MRSWVGTNVVVVLGIVLGACRLGYAQDYEPTLWVYCTFYDYHADETNPNFQPAGLQGSGYDGNFVRRGMVLPELDSDRKPVKNGANDHPFHFYLNQWFRPSGASNQQVFTVTNDFRGEWSNLVQRSGRPNEFIVGGRNESDAMIDIVMYDSLLFTLTDATTGTYEYDNQAFFPLNGRGWGAEPKKATYWMSQQDAENNTRNYSFAMEIHRSFTHKDGLVFHFEGDDDVWCFINNRLVMDLGGIHGQQAGTVNLDNIGGLVPGESYTFDFFYCERNVTASHIHVSTNIVSAVPPGEVLITAEPNDVIWEGDTVHLTAEVKDDKQTPRPDWAAATEWHVEGGDPANQGLTSPTGAATDFIGSVGSVDGLNYTIWGKACNLDAPDKCKSDTVQIRVLRAKLTDLTIEPATAVVRSGESVSLSAKVFDNFRNQQRDVTGAYGSHISWEMVMDPDSGSGDGDDAITNSSGPTTTFNAERAYSCYLVTATVTDTNTNEEFSATARICVTPGEPCCVWIEGDTVIAESELRDANPQDLVTLNSSTNSATVGAVVRDAGGNFVRLANATTTQWQSSDAGVASVAAAGANVAQVGVITRQTTTSGTCQGTATEPGLQSDDVTIQVVQGEVDELFFVDYDGHPVSSVDIETDDSLGLKLRAVLTTGDTVDWSGTWTLTPGDLTYDGVDPPAPGGSWMYRPITPGTGELCATSGSAEHCIPVNIRRSPPSKVEMRLLTPDSLRIAGETLYVEVKITNGDGLVPGFYCFGPDTTPRARYADPAGPIPPGQPLPEVFNDWDAGNVNRYFTDGTYYVDQCFEGGIDTVGFVLYYAPDDGTMHQLCVDLDDLRSNTQQFKLHPGPLDSMVYTFDEAGDSVVPDTITVEEEDEFTVIYAQGYDQWMNPRGPTPSLWEGDSTLVPPPGIKAWVYIDASVANSQAGNLVATAVEDQSVSTSTFVILPGIAPRIVAAATADTNGNGLLDAVVVTFSQPVDLSAPGAVDALLAGISVEDDDYDVEWSNAGLIGQNGTLTDSVFVLSLVETNPDTPQTGWTPRLTVSGVTGIGDVVLGDISDGAAPVVWHVYKILSPGEDRSEDTYKVIFSEEVAKPGGAITPWDTPSDLFVVYTEQVVNGETTFVAVEDNILDGIGGLSAVSDTTLYGQTLGMVDFKMENGNQLYSHHYVNIKTEPEAIVVDQVTPEPNVPGDNNQKVRVVPLGDYKFDPQPVPNPSGPDEYAFSDDGLKPGELRGGYQYGAVDYVAAGGSGWATVFSVLVPDEGTCSQVIKVYRKIYDVAGNLVNEGIEQDLLQTVRDAGQGSQIAGGAVLDIEIYWNGFNSEGLPVAPGVYREVLFLDYECPTHKDQRAHVTYGVRTR